MEDIKIIKGITIECEDEKEARELAGRIHNQIVSHCKLHAIDDYTNDYIVLNLTGNMVYVTFDNRCLFVPNLFI